MKVFKILSIFLFTITGIFAQAPQKISYQAVIRNAAQELVQEQVIGVEVSILQGDPSGLVVFQETHQPTTNINGLVSLEIGAGIPVVSQLASIDWASGPYFIRIGTDPNGGVDYSIVGTSQLISVPYALYAEKSGESSGDTDWVENIPNNIITTNRNIALQVGLTQPFKVNVAAPAGIARLEAGANDGIGVQGNTNIGYGVRGTAGQGIGVHGVAGNFGDGILGEAQNGVGVHGKSMGHGILGESALNNGVQGNGIEGYGVSGHSVNESGVYGVSDNGDGVTGMAVALNQIAVNGIAVGGVGVEGSSETHIGVQGFTEGNNQAGVMGDGGELSVGVQGESVHKYGVQGESETGVGTYGESMSNYGVEGKTEAEVQEVFELGPAGIGAGTGDKSGVYGHSFGAFGGVFTSNQVSGLFALSSLSNGITAKTVVSNPDRAAVYAVASKSAAGVLGWSIDGTGVKGKSKTGKAGEFEGEVHIENGEKAAKLLIQNMEDDNEAPILVWSEDNYVRKREGWTIDSDGYFASNRGIRVNSGSTPVFEVNPDGTSYHKGLEIFEGGLIVPAGDVDIRLLPDDGISIFSSGAEDYLFHANLNGDAFAAESFYSEIIGADIISANEKNFMIDHPLDPENKYLVHTSIESDERINVYSGNIITNELGFAEVTLPDWFEALNRDFRYQLTVIGSFSQAIIAKEIVDSSFTIQSEKPNIKVSWQVTGVRHDQWAKDNPTRVVVEKERLE